VAESHPERSQSDYHTTQTQTQHPIDRRQLAQPLRLICPINALWVVAKGAATTAATVTIHRYAPIAAVSHRLTYFTPTLEDFTLTIATFPRTNFCFSLDIWQLQDDNRHGKLQFDDRWRTTILLGACLFVSKPTAYVTDTSTRPSPYLTEERQTFG
jgi:hypothetical protein